MITIFKNIKETSTPFYRDVEFVFDRIKNGKYAELVDQIRKEDDKSTRNELKKGLPAICFSGQFKKRADDAIIEHSGLICLDFDGYENSGLMLEDKHAMTENPYVMAVFVSPSGNGLKVIVKIPAEPDNHKRYFEALQEHFDSKYFDVTSKNISRVCYESSDPDMYINMESDVWTELAELEGKTVDKYDVTTTIPVTDEGVIIERLMKWWNRKYGLVDGERNHNVFILASAFNEFGIMKHTAEIFMSSMAQSDFPMSEIRTTINSAYSNTSAFGTKFYEDEAQLQNIRKKIKGGASSSEIKKDLRRLEIDEGNLNEVYEAIEKTSGVDKFWSVSDKGAVSLQHFLFKEFLEDNGFYKFTPHGSDKYIFVRVTNNLIDKASEEEVKDFVLSYVLEAGDMIVYNFFADKTRYFKEDFLSFLDTVNIHFVEDTKYESFIYFRNCALRVTKEKIESIDYIDLGGYVWRDQVIDRDWSVVEVNGCDFKTFIRNISGNEDKRISSLESAIGFLMSSYKDPGYCPSIILNDEEMSNDPEGGTGKGIFAQAISKMKKVSYIDGKAFSFDKSFAYQTISTDTQVVTFDDVKKGFDFERLFSVITEGITIEKKNKDAISIPFKYSPKIIITTNYTVRGTGNSFVRRKFELELKQYYKADFTPVDEFGKRLFDEWTEDEWLVFDNYMINNLQFFLKHGLIASDSKNSKIKKLGQETRQEFIEWCGLVEGSLKSDLIVYDKRIFKDDLYNDFILDNPDYAPKAKYTISRTLFYKWLDLYGKFLENVEVTDGREKMGRWIMFNTKKENNVSFEGRDGEDMFEF